MSRPTWKRLIQQVRILRLHRQDFYLIAPVIFINRLHSIQQAFTPDAADNSVELPLSCSAVSLILVALPPDTT